MSSGYHQGPHRLLVLRPERKQAGSKKDQTKNKKCNWKFQMQIIILFTVHCGTGLVDKKGRAVENSMACPHLGTFCKG